ncbi:MAG TPA: MauE/DoxX family redox-associated membrane protein, partial [Paracoccus sp. (in: a-proteobacteria)]|nr:MauE/DoxX family redox-associated membrane protein [Paracoccus sp. (in: a-proteobacteria)]
MAQEFLSQPTVLLFLRVFLALMFAHAALSKLGHRDEFFGVVRNFLILPEG